eukprot:Rhum_TRINITY_DN14596_c20_g1::Rhum_TRINITY_DN14596_c20_g1_i1::g.101080::m.101080
MPSSAYALRELTTELSKLSNEMQLMSDVRYRDSSYSAAPASPALQQPWAAYPQQAGAVPPQVAPPLMPQNVFLPATAQVIMPGAIPPVSAPAPAPAPMPAQPQPQPQPTQVAAVMPHGHTPGQPLMVQVPDGRQFTVIAPALAPGEQFFVQVPAPAPIPTVHPIDSGGVATIVPSAAYHSHPLHPQPPPPPPLQLRRRFVLSVGS